MSLPSERQLIEALASQQDPVLRRDLAKKFHIKGEERRLFRTFLAELAKKGKILKQGKAYTYRSPKDAKTKTQKPSEKSFVTRAVQRRDTRESQKIIGRFTTVGPHGLIQPLSKKSRHEYTVEATLMGDACDGDFVEAEILQQSRHRYTGRVLRVLNKAKDNLLTPSDISILEHDLPRSFSDETLKEAAKSSNPSLGHRRDLRALPLVTIDDKDARDFDDAVWAQADDAPDNPGGWQMWVAIADVAHYVAQNSSLDREALERGNSVYFPDQVIPMLPEALSNELCSLKPEVDRACLAVFMRITKTGKLISHHFARGLMRSAKRLTYTQVQDAIDKGQATDLSADFIRETLRPLYGAYQSLKKGRHYRGVLELNLEEQKLVLDTKGFVTAVETRERLESHQLIEEFMVLANVAAASTLDDAGLLCLFRVHDQPTPEKVDSLRHFLKLMSIEFSKGQRISPKVFNNILKKVAGSPHEQAVNELVLRSQAQAVYTPDNIGHFGLGLARYAHFTSPIRRYSDLLVHRALLHCLDKQPAKTFPYSRERFEEMGDHLSQVERRASKAERQSKDRFIGQYLADKVDDVFEGRISGVGEVGPFHDPH